MFDIPMDLKLLEKEIIAYEQEPIEKGKILSTVTLCLPAGAVPSGATAEWMRISA